MKLNLSPFKQKISTILLILLFISCTKNTEAERLESDFEKSFHSELASNPTFTEALGDSLAPAEKRGLKSMERKLNRLNFEDSIQSLYNEIGLASYHLKYEPFRFAMIGFLGLKQDGRLNEKNLLSIIDFSQTSCDKRFYTIDLDNKKVLYNTLVSHGKNTGLNTVKSFSNAQGSNQSSLGFYVTAETYVGSKGYSMRLDGMERNYNDNMRKRAVVMHNADYVSDSWVKKYGRIGRSLGCPALPKEISKQVIDTIKDKTAIFAYYNDQKYIKASNYLNLEKLMERFDQDYLDVQEGSVEIQQ